MSALRNILRILLGMLFVFSGFVKGVDPMGTAYKIEDYMIAYGTQWAMPFTVILSVVLCAIEFSIGVYLLFNLKPKMTSWLAFLMMIYFTVVTFFDALYNLVPDCGCFGDALKLTNWETFYKNIVLIIIAFLVFIYRKQFKSPFSAGTGWILAVIIPVVFIWFEIYNIRHLPTVEFTAWKVGNRMLPKDPRPVNYYLIYQNKKTGETKEYLSKELPYTDSVFMAEYVYKDTRIDDPNIYPAPNFRIMDTIGNDVTRSYMQNTIFFVCQDISKSNPEAMQKAALLIDHLNKSGYNVVGLSGSEIPLIDSVKAKYKLDISFFQADDIELKTMVRSNPGLVSIKDAVVMKKWHFNDFPVDLEMTSVFPRQ